MVNVKVLWNQAGRVINVIQRKGNLFCHEDGAFQFNLVLCGYLAWNF